METDKTTEGDVDTTTNEGEGEKGAETVSVPKADYDKMNQTLGSLKRELKDLKKPKEEPKETSTTNAKSEDNRLLDRLEKMSLRQAGISHEDDITLARNTAKKWNMDIDDVLADDDFKIKLDRQQSERSNVQATSGIKGGAGVSKAKDTPEYWLSKGKPPTREEVPDRAARAKINKAFMDGAKSTKKFYND